MSAVRIVVVPRAEAAAMQVLVDRLAAVRSIAEVRTAAEEARAKRRT